jgi:hypothetical protein
MKAPGLLALTKREQRVVAVIVLVLLLAALTKHYRYARAHGASPMTTTTQPVGSPVASPPQEERESPDESP